MSVHKKKTKAGLVWRTQWRDEFGRQRSRTFSRKRDADAYDAKIRLAKRQGELASLDAGRQKLEDLIADWWRLYAEPNLAPKTLLVYAGLRDRHLLPRLGQLELRALTPERLQTFQLELAADAVGRETIRKTLAMLQGALERAVEWGRLPRNPARYVRKPSPTRSTQLVPPGPHDVERLRRALLGRGHQRDAAFVSVLGYAGLRPGEALALRWGDVKGRSLMIDKALSLGEERATKTGRRRIVPLLAPLASDLAEFRLASGRPSDDALVFPTREGLPWKDTDFRNWRRRRFGAALRDCGLTMRPYDLRHGLASLLLAEQRNPAEVAGYMGHSLQTLFSTYAHVIEDLRGQSHVDAEDEIRAARLFVAEHGLAAWRDDIGLSAKAEGDSA